MRPYIQCLVVALDNRFQGDAPTVIIDAIPSMNVVVVDGKLCMWTGVILFPYVRANLMAVLWAINWLLVRIIFIFLILILLIVSRWCNLRTAHVAITSTDRVEQLRVLFLIRVKAFMIIILVSHRIQTELLSDWRHIWLYGRLLRIRLTRFKQGIVGFWVVIHRNYIRQCLWWRDNSSKLF